MLALTLALAAVWLAPARRARRLIDTRRASEALQVLEDAEGKLPESVQLQLKAAALYQLNRSTEARELLKGFKADDETAPLEPLVVEALAEDFGRKEVPSVRELLKGVPKARALPVLQALAQDEKGRAQWGALRFVDLEYAGQGLPIVALYARALQSSDCGVRNLAARRLGELKNPEAVPALEALRELPRRKGTFSDDDCGQTQAANAVRAIRKDQL
jgi:serine/threonine-protein kinase